MTILVGWILDLVANRVAVASDARMMIVNGGEDGLHLDDKTIVAMRIKLVDNKGNVTALLGTHSNGAPYLKLFGKSKKNYAMIEPERITLVEGGSDAILIDATDDDRRIDVFHSKNRPVFTIDSDNDGACAMYLRNKNGSSIGFSCEADGAVMAGFRALKQEGGITLAVSPNGTPVISLNKSRGKGALSLYCYESAPGITLTSPAKKSQAIMGWRCDMEEDPSTTWFRILDESNATLWKAP
jgi:hypothetical protein